MRIFTVLVMVVAAVFLGVPPASAVVYDFFLTQWNVTELNTAGDKVHVEISGKTVTFTWVDGNSIDPAAFNLQNIWYTLGVQGVAGTGTATGYTTADPCGVVSMGNPNGLCTADGFGQFRGEAIDLDPSVGSRQTSVVLTFANDLASGLDANAFALHVQYNSGCSGFVDGTIGGSSITSQSACTPVPEPITMFLGGTGLLILGYAARKRLFRQFTS